MRQDCWQDSVPWGLFDWGPQFLSGIWPETFSSPVPCGPLQHGSLFHQKHSSSKGNRVLARQKVTIFYNLVTEVTSQHLYHILLIRNRWLGLAHMEGEGFHKGVDTKKRASLGAILDLVCHSARTATPWILSKCYNFFFPVGETWKSE